MRCGRNAAGSEKHSQERGVRYICEVLAITKGLARGTTEGR